MFDHLKKTKFTLYTPIGNTYKKTILEDCVKRQSLELSFISQGTFSIDSIKLYIFDLSKYMTNGTLEDDTWEILVGSERKFSYLVEGICPFEFPLESSEQDLMQNIKLFEKSYKYRKAQFVKDNSGANMPTRHIQVIC